MRLGTRASPTHAHILQALIYTLFPRVSESVLSKRSDIAKTNAHFFNTSSLQDMILGIRENDSSLRSFATWREQRHGTQPVIVIAVAKGISSLGTQAAANIAKKIGAQKKERLGKLPIVVRAIRSRLSSIENALPTLTLRHMARL
jgi:hypothetical protein